MRAFAIVHWPGKDVVACSEHAIKLIRIGAFLGITVSMTLLPDGPEDARVECANCENQGCRG